MHEGSCHCGAVRLTLPSTPEVATDCNCSLCRRIGGPWVYFEFGTVKVEAAPDATSAYVQGDRTLRTLHCRTCGCVTHWEPIEAKPGARHGVNLGNFDPQLIARVRVRKFDGADSWRFETLFDALGGAAAVLRLAHAWHGRVLADEVVAHAFSHGFHPRHTERLAAYWGEAWGGPAAYSQQYGNESQVVRMHSGNGPHDEMDRRAIECFDGALDDVGVADERLRRALHDYFAWATTTSMAAYPASAAQVPDGLRVPRWSWDGLQP